MDTRSKQRDRDFILDDWTKYQKWMKLQQDMQKFDKIHGIGDFAKPIKQG